MIEDVTGSSGSGPDETAMITDDAIEPVITSLTSEEALAILKGVKKIWTGEGERAKASVNLCALKYLMEKIASDMKNEDVLNELNASGIEDKAVQWFARLFVDKSQINSAKMNARMKRSISMLNAMTVEDLAAILNTISCIDENMLEAVVKQIQQSGKLTLELLDNLNDEAIDKIMKFKYVEQTVDCLIRMLNAKDNNKMVVSVGVIGRLAKHLNSHNLTTVVSALKYLKEVAELLYEARDDVIENTCKWNEIIEKEIPGNEFAAIINEMNRKDAEATKTVLNSLRIGEVMMKALVHFDDDVVRIVDEKMMASILNIRANHLLDAELMNVVTKLKHCGVRKKMWKHFGRQMLGVIMRNIRTPKELAEILDEIEQIEENGVKKIDANTVSKVAREIAVKYLRMWHKMTDEDIWHSLASMLSLTDDVKEKVRIVVNEFSVLERKMLNRFDWLDRSSRYDFYVNSAILHDMKKDETVLIEDLRGILSVERDEINRLETIEQAGRLLKCFDKEQIGSILSVIKGPREFAAVVNAVYESVCVDRNAKREILRHVLNTILDKDMTDEWLRMMLGILTVSMDGNNKECLHEVIYILDSEGKITDEMRMYLNDAVKTTSDSNEEDDDYQSILDSNEEDDDYQSILDSNEEDDDYQSILDSKEEEDDDDDDDDYQSILDSKEEEEDDDDDYQSILDSKEEDDDDDQSIAEGESYNANSVKTISDSEDDANSEDAFKAKTNESRYKLTVEEFASAADDTLKKDILSKITINQKKLFLIELSERMEESIPEPTEADMHHAQERIDKETQEIIDKVWRVYGDDSVYDLLLDMSDKERKMVLKQLGRGHEINALIYVGTKKEYENEEGRKDDVKRIFDAIEDERRNELVNDIVKKESWLYYNISTFNDLMRVLKGSVEYKKIADMLLGVKDKSRVADMIDQIRISRDGYVYLANILLGIDNDEDLESMISDLKKNPILIARVLSGVDEVGKLSRLFNIIESSATSERYMETVLYMLVINKNIVSELIDKPEDRQNEILKGINNIQIVLVDKIKFVIEEAQSEQDARRKEAEEQAQEARAKLMAAEEQKRMNLEITIISIVVLVAVIEIVVTRMSIKNALMNGHAISDEAVISRMAMAAVTVVMILSVIVYVKCANKPVWYDRLMIGGSVVMALVRVLMGVYEGICEGVNMNECVRVRVRVRMMAVMIAVMMAIASVVAVINGGNEKNDGVYVSKNAGRIAKNVIVVVSTCVMAITEWVVQRMGVDVDVSNEVNNEMLQ